MESPKSWYYILPMTLLMLGLFGFLAWQNIDGIQDVKVVKKTAPVVPTSNEQVIEFEDEEEEVDPAAEQKLEKQKKADRAAKESQLAALERLYGTSSEEAAEMRNFIIEQFGTTTEEKDETAGVELMVSEDEIVSLIKVHNKARFEVGVKAISWSDNLAKKAQAWTDDLAARDCTLEHANTKFGENLFKGTVTGPDPSGFGVERVMKEWMSEIENFDAETMTCAEGEVCGHYTQIVWADSRSVGCGYSECLGEDTSSRIWACNYDPTGNVEDELPY